MDSLYPEFAPLTAKICALGPILSLFPSSEVSYEAVTLLNKGRFIGLLCKGMKEAVLTYVGVDVHCGSVQETD